MSTRRRFIPVPPKVANGRFISLGGSGIVYQITPHDIAVKYAWKSKPDQFAQFTAENATYDRFEAVGPSPYVIQSFLRTEVANFLPFLEGGSLDARLRSNQETRHREVFRVVRLEDRRLAERWTAEIAAGVAWLEALGIAHGDLRPTNVMLDGRDHCKLIDFDCAQPFGVRSYGGCPPWCRARPANEGGGWGDYGPDTEQFALGSIAYNVTRGYELYDEPGGTRYEGEEVLNMLSHRVFPCLDEHDEVDRIITKCWMAEYESLAELARSAGRLPGANDMHEATVLSREYCEEMREKCRELVDDGLLDGILE